MWVKNNNMDDKLQRHWERYPLIKLRSRSNGCNGKKVRKHMNMCHHCSLMGAGTSWEGPLGSSLVHFLQSLRSEISHKLTPQQKRDKHLTIVYSRCRDTELQTLCCQLKLQRSFTIFLRRFFSFLSCNAGGNRETKRTDWFYRLLSLHNTGEALWINVVLLTACSLIHLC